MKALARALGVLVLPSEAACVVSAEARGLTVPVYEAERVVFARRDGLALALEPCWSEGRLVARVCPAVALAGALDGAAGGYGVLPWDTAREGLGSLLDAFARWTGEDALAQLLARTAGP